MSGVLLVLFFIGWPIGFGLGMGLGYLLGVNSIKHRMALYRIKMRGVQDEVRLDRKTLRAEEKMLALVERGMEKVRGRPT